MFNFRIIDTPDGNQLIDRTLRTPYSALTPLEMLEYMEIEEQLAFMDRMKSNRKRKHMRRLERNPFYRLACMCGML